MHVSNGMSDWVSDTCFSMVYICTNKTFWIWRKPEMLDTYTQIEREGGVDLVKNFNTCNLQILQLTNLQIESFSSDVRVSIKLCQFHDKNEQKIRWYMTLLAHTLHSYHHTQIPYIIGTRNEIARYKCIWKFS